MLRDPECAVVGTFSGAMSVAKMGLLICDMIDRGWLKMVITTGALIAHGFIETLGRVHYKYPENVSDRELFQQGYNRIYDTLEMEANLDYAEDVFRAVLERLDQDQGGPPPAFAGSWGNIWRSRATAPGSCAMPISKGCRCSSRPSPIRSWAWTWRATWCGGPWRTGRNWRGPGGGFPEVQSLPGPGGICPKGPGGPETGDLHRGRGRAPELGPAGGAVPGIAATRLKLELPEVRFHYGVRLCPEPAHWGGLSGCTFKEGVSWGKFVSPEDGGRYAEVLCDATIAWPLLLKGVTQRLEKGQAA